MVIQVVFLFNYNMIFFGISVLFFISKHSQLFLFTYVNQRAKKIRYIIPKRVVYNFFSCLLTLITVENSTTPPVNVHCPNGTVHTVH